MMSSSNAKCDDADEGKKKKKQHKRGAAAAAAKAKSYSVIHCTPRTTGSLLSCLSRHLEEGSLISSNSRNRLLSSLSI